MGNTIFLVALDPVCHFFSFQCFMSTLIHQGRRSRKRSIEKEIFLMEESLRRIKITNAPQDHEGTFHTRSGLPLCLEPGHRQTERSNPMNDFWCEEA
jgi:hypothetical protein